MTLKTKKQLTFLGIVLFFVFGFAKKKELVGTYVPEDGDFEDFGTDGDFNEDGFDDSIPTEEELDFEEETEIYDISGIGLKSKSVKAKMNKIKMAVPFSRIIDNKEFLEDDKNCETCT